MMRSLPTAKPMRQPGIEKVFDIEVNSTVDVHRARHLQHRRRRIVVEIDLRIGEIGQDEELVLLREGDEVPVEIEVGDIGGRIGRIADDDRDRLRDRMDARRARARGRTPAFGSAGTERITPPAIRKPKAWIG